MEDENLVISPDYFKIKKLLVSSEIPYYELNQVKSKQFLKKFHNFSNGNFRVLITWKTRGIRLWFYFKVESSNKLYVF